MDVYTCAIKHMKKIVCRSTHGSKSISIVGGGDISKTLLASIRASEFCIGVDRGALWLIQHNIVPKISIGDFDSVTTRERAMIETSRTQIVTFPSEKDATDLDLAADKAIRLKARTVVMFGVLGRRFDHAMGAIAVLKRLASHNIYGEIVDNFNKIYIVRREKKKISRDQTYPYVSVLALTNRTILSLSGFRYNVSKYRFSLQHTVGISNEIPGPFATITVHQGAALIIRSHD